MEDGHPELYWLEDPVTYGLELLDCTPEDSLV